ncbi:MAG: hypothetical protein K0S19_1491 [Geminicoccaceae bacterium]|nr:hypothetical protein [Geminicoccaceae bacterium]
MNRVQALNRLRLAFAALGFVLAFASIALNDSWLGWAAIAVLLISLAARLISHKRQDGNSPDQGL